jgi:hypothetical protein
VNGEAADVHAEDRLGVRLGLGPVAGHLDPARLTAPADHREAELFRGHHRLGNRRGVAAIGHRHPVFFEHLLALVFEEIHGG